MPSWGPGRGELADLMCACDHDEGALSGIEQGLALGQDALGLGSVVRTVQVRGEAWAGADVRPTWPENLQPMGQPSNAPMRRHGLCRVRVTVFRWVPEPLGRREDPTHCHRPPGCDQPRPAESDARVRKPAGHHSSQGKSLAMLLVLGCR